MARNKYPEKTVEKILAVSYQLFVEKGYEKTTIQDIVVALGMSKGAIYHHFKSKEDILNALCEQSFMTRNSMQTKISEGLNGLEKIKAFMKFEFSNTEKQSIDRMSAELFQIPKFAMVLMKDTLAKSASLFAQMIEDAVADGSAQVKDPLMCAQVMMILSNLWANPMMHGNDKELFLRKTRTIGSIMEHMGLPIVDEELMSIIADYYDQIQTV